MYETQATPHHTELEATLDQIIVQLTRTTVPQEREQLIEALIETAQQLTELEYAGGE
jgi:hypothetical protein